MESKDRSHGQVNRADYHAVSLPSVSTTLPRPDVFQSLPVLSYTPGHPLSFLRGVPTGLQHGIRLQSLAVWPWLPRHPDRNVDSDSLGPNLALSVHPSAEHSRKEARREGIRARVPITVQYRWCVVLRGRSLLVRLDDISFSPLDSAYHRHVPFRHRHHLDICRNLHFPGRGLSAVCGQCVVGQFICAEFFRGRVPPLWTTDVQYSWVSLGYNVTRVFDPGDGAVSVSVLRVWQEASS